MFGVRGLLGMVGNIEDRRVALYETDGLIVSTVAVTDSEQPYETAIEHPQYKGGRWIVVEMYETKDDAAAGHKRWVTTMTADKLPSTIEDVSTCVILTILESICDDNQRTFEASAI